jgi:signal transduction histidine kinase
LAQPNQSTMNNLNVSMTEAGRDAIVVLLVDDQALVGALVRRSLAEYPEIAIHHCADAEKALDEANRISPTVILQDLVMPGIDGLTQVARFRSNPATVYTPIIILSTKEDAGTKSDSFAAGANDYLIKLPDKVELIARIRYHSKAFHNHLQRELAEKRRREMEVHLRQSQKLESVGQLAAGMAHEINTPIQYLASNTQFLQGAFQDLLKLFGACKDLRLGVKASASQPELVAKVESTEQAIDMDYLTKEIPKAIEQSLAGIDRVSKIVLAMKEFALSGSDAKTATDLNRTVETTVTIAQHEWSAVAELVTNLDQSLPSVECLSGEINQVLLNLIVNAAHAIEERKDGKGTITISTGHAGDSAEIRVSDTGTGIPEDIRDKIFDPFFTTKGVGKGSGQGLTIAHSVIVGKHGGALTFETELGKGSTFIVRLPLMAKPGPPQTDE